MKTAKEILLDCFLGVIDFNEEAAIGAMKAYAEQAIDLVAETAFETSDEFEIITKESIVKVKKELK